MSTDEPVVVARMAVPSAFADGEQTLPALRRRIVKLLKQIEVLGKAGVRHTRIAEDGLVELITDDVEVAQTAIDALQTLANKPKRQRKPRWYQEPSDDA